MLNYCNQVVDLIRSFDLHPRVTSTEFVSYIQCIKIHDMRCVAMLLTIFVPHLEFKTMVLCFKQIKPWCYFFMETKPVLLKDITTPFVIPNKTMVLLGLESWFCRGITRIHRSPSRPSHPYGRQPHSLIFMNTLYKATCCLPASS